MKHLFNLGMKTLMAREDGYGAAGGGYGGAILVADTIPGSYQNTSGPLPEHYTSGDTDQFLTEQAVERMLGNDRFIAPQAFPTVYVPTQYGSIKTWDRGSLLRHEMRPHSYADRPVQAGYKPGPMTSYACEHWSLERPVDPKDQAMSRRDPMRPKKNATSYLTKQAELNIDLRWSRDFFHPDAWGFNYRGVASNPSQASDSPEFLQFDQAGAQGVIEYLRGRKIRMDLMTGETPNTLVLGVDVYNYLTVTDEDIRDRIKYTQGGLATTQLLQDYFEVDKIVVARNIVNDGKEGLPNDFKYIFPTDGMLFCYVNRDNPDLELPSAGYMAVWEALYQQFPGDQTRILNDMALIRTGIDGRSGVTWVQAHTAVGMSQSAADLGMFFTNVVSRKYSAK